MFALYKARDTIQATTESIDEQDLNVRTPLLFGVGVRLAQFFMQYKLL
ncbi:TPA: hypothetical protein KKW30_000010 [Legionella pneumophila]|nr:hypothetical protein [Legionella pneumophila]MCK1850584.1 hypothetical protein [Legionella pneumophila]MDI9851474.1 hypothetical protein [Legionella pneumophila]STX89732.1 Uncharacterised protein [Legionella pneumophila]HAT1699212.1 hypothetical protein [Legionella pneumophila]HAT1702370.1 hypothetical protein [Legionella pneumophila]